MIVNEKGLKTSAYKKGLTIMTTKVDTIIIFVEISKQDHRKLEFEVDQVTGLQIKIKAEIPPENDLAWRQQGKLVLVINEETITIKNGEHFVSLPAGTIS
jgi:hypothetical protein